MKRTFLGVARLTDELAGTGSYASTLDFGLGDFDWDDSEPFWREAREAAASASEGWDLLQLAQGAGASSSVESAQMFTLMGFAHRMLGENHRSRYWRTPGQPNH